MQRGGYQGDRGGGFRGRGDFGRGGGDRGGGFRGRGDFGGRGGGRGPQFSTGRFQFEQLRPFAADRLPTELIPPRSWSGKSKGEGFSSEAAPKKPAGRHGTPLEIVVNMVNVAIPAAPKVQYQVEIQPELILKRRRKYLVKTILEAEFPTTRCLFDGENIVYFDEQPGGKAEFSFAAKLTEPGGQDGEYTAKFKFTASAATSKLDKPALAFFCTHFKQAVSTLPDRKLVGRDYFDFSHKIPVPEHSCVLVPGVDMTVYLTEAGPLLNADMMFKHIRTDTIFEIIRRDYRDRGAPNDVIAKQFVGKVAMRSYGDQGSFIIDAVRFDMTPASVFQGKEGPTSFAAYFRKHYNLDTADLDKPQPLLESRSRTKRGPDGEFQISHFIPALCNLTGATDDMKKDMRRGRDLIRHTALRPHERMEKLCAFFEAANRHPPFIAALEPWQVKVGQKLAQIAGRRLPTPVLKNGAGPVAINPDRESWDVKFEWPMFRSGKFDKWVVVIHAQSGPTREFVDILRTKMGPWLHVPFAEPKVFTVGSQRPDDYVRVIREQVVPLRPDFIFCVLPRKIEAPYKRVKDYLCTEAGIVSQFVTEDNISREPLVKATKIAVQMNVKAGGAPWAVDCKFQVPTMVIGLDIHHGGDLEHRGGSVAAFVASLDKDVTQFYSRTFVIKAREGVLEPAPGQPTLEQLVSAAIDKFKEVNKIYPGLLLVYRDGGSEGQIHHLVQHEVGEIRKGLAARPECSGKCKLVYFSVLKGIRTRIFQKEPGGQGIANPPPGTVVDTAITSNILSEFFLVAQSVNQGSATPTKYQSLYDDTPAPNLEMFETWTYNLAHNYYNWFGTVRTPCVLKYASTLAKFSGTFLRGKEVKAAIMDRLFYL